LPASIRDNQAVTLVSALPSPRLAQLGDDVGIEQERQEKSAGRGNSCRRGGSKSMSDNPGMATASTRLWCLLVIRWYKDVNRCADRVKVSEP